MAEDNLRSFTMDGILAGLLLFSLLAFAIGFMAYNNPTGLGTESGEVLADAYTNSSNYITEVPTDANTLLNITANTNPEVSDLGSRDSVASGYSATRTGKGSWEAAKDLFTWVFTGTTGTILLSVIGGLLGMFSMFLIVKWIRQGN